MRAANRVLGFVGLLCFGVALPSRADGPRAEHDPGPRTEVAERVRRGDYGGALDALEVRAGGGFVTATGTVVAHPGSVVGDGPSPGQAYVRGRLLELLGRFEEAEAAYGAADAAPLPPPLQVDARRRRAVVQGRLGRCTEAMAELEPWAKTGAVLGRVHAGACAARLGRVADAERWFSGLLASPGEAADRLGLRLLLARAHRAAGQLPRARAGLREALLEDPDHPEVHLARAELEALEGVPLQFTFEEQLRRAEALIAAREHARALAVLEEAGRPTAPALLEGWLHLQAEALFKMRGRYGEAAERYLEEAALGGRGAPWALVEAGRAWLRHGELTKALRTFDRFLKQHPKHPAVPNVVFMAGKAALDGGRADGRRRLERLTAGGARGRIEGQGLAEYRREALWCLAFHDFEHGRMKPARESLVRYAASSNDVLVKARGLYWLGRVEQRARRRAEAVRAYTEALRVEPLHWYALLARERLVALGEVPPPPFPDGKAPVSERPRVELPPATEFLWAHGFDQDAREMFAEERGAAVRGDRARSLATALVLGDTNGAYRLASGFGDVLGAAPTPGTRWIWDAAYPRAHAEHVERAAREHGLRPEHLWGIMRQESGYDPLAISYADALGLMQLLPTTAERVGARLGLSVTRDRLFEPRWNVTLGAAYSAKLHRDFDGVLPLAIGAYNAGENNMTRWLRARGPMELDRFVEHIPADQTRNYVRRVMTHYARYVFLQTGGGSWPDVPLPARVTPPKEIIRE